MGSRFMKLITKLFDSVIHLTFKKNCKLYVNPIWETLNVFYHIYSFVLICAFRWKCVVIPMLYILLKYERENKVSSI